ncbi:MAG: adenine deaminase [Ignavibacteria bacterium]|nr:adenine deaminase [Ignavibacteria bacterium]
MKDISHKLAVARGEAPADLVFRNAKIVNVLSGEIHDGDVAVSGGRIVALGETGSAKRCDGIEIVDLRGRYLAPALIDGHIHIESTMLTVGEFAKAVVPHGTGAAVIDPHEYANVAGLAGIDYLLEAARLTPLSIFVMMSSCVPATPLETAGAALSADDIASRLGRPNVAGIAEMMNFPGVFLGWESELAKIALGKRTTVDGHAPGLTGGPLNAYILAGVKSDHECTTLAEAREKLRRGMHILLREGTAERNLHDLLPLVTPANAMNFSFATDDKHPADLEDEGHIDHHVREAIAFGIDPVTAFQLAGISTARHYRLRNLGAIAPRFHADLIVFDDLHNVRASMVYHRGRLVAEDGRYLLPDAPPPDDAQLRDTMRVRPFAPSALSVAARGAGNIKVIDLVPRQIVTRAGEAAPVIVDGAVVADPSRDILKLAVIERHTATGNIGIGFVRGFGLRRGALASTVAHDAHNIIVVGADDDDMTLAARELERMGGGQCVVDGGEVIERLALPLCGLVSDQPLRAVREKVDALLVASQRLGCTLPDPFMTLSFLALSPIPALKVTDLGLVDAVRFELTDVYV